MLSFTKSSNDLKSKLEALDRSQAFIEFEPDGTIIEANENFINAMGYSLDEIRGKHHAMFVDKLEASSDDYKNFWRDLANGTFKSGEFKRLDKNGREVWIQASYNPMLDKNGKAFRVVKIAADITDKKQRGFENEGQVDAINRSNAVIHFTPDGTIVKANENFLGTLGYSQQEVVGNHHRMFMDPEEAASPDYKQFWQSLANGEFQSNEYKRLGKGGREMDDGV